MAETLPPLCESHLVRIEPGDRLVVLARTIQTRDPVSEAALRDGAVDWRRFGAPCLGQALYRHRSVFQGDVDAPLWSHLELSYFRNTLPADAVHDLVLKRQAAGTDLLRAEVLLTTPFAFILPRDWHGSADRPERQVSLEYIEVQASHLGEYRDVMRDYCSPAAAKLVGANRIGTFRAMETAAVLYHDPELKIDWNQIHLCEVEPDGFQGFGPAFEAALREESPDRASFAGVFTDLDRIRRVTLWTFNDPVVEADAAVGTAS